LIASEPASAPLSLCFRCLLLGQSIESPFGSLLVELCRLMFRSFSFSKNCIFTLRIFQNPGNISLLLPSHNCIIISQCSVFKVHPSLC